jgi:hypothetical protein
MNEVAVRVATAGALLWLGVMLAISFLEAPLKFHGPGVDLRTGLAIGRIVFRALNLSEVGLAAVIAASLIVYAPSVSVTVAAVAAVAVLAVQLRIVRPRLNRRSDRVLAGEDAPRSISHHVHIVTEATKVIALAVLGACQVSA